MAEDNANTAQPMVNDAEILLRSVKFGVSK